VKTNESKSPGENENDNGGNNNNNNIINSDNVVSFSSPVLVVDNKFVFYNDGCDLIYTGDNNISNNSNNDNVSSTVSSIQLKSFLIANRLNFKILLFFFFFFLFAFSFSLCSSSVSGSEKKRRKDSNGSGMSNNNNNNNEYVHDDNPYNVFSWETLFLEDLKPRNEINLSEIEFLHSLPSPCEEKLVEVGFFIFLLSSFYFSLFFCFFLFCALWYERRESKREWNIIIIIITMRNIDTNTHVLLFFVLFSCLFTLPLIMCSWRRTLLLFLFFFLSLSLSIWYLLM